MDEAKSKGRIPSDLLECTISSKIKPRSLGGSAGSRATVSQTGQAVRASSSGKGAAAGVWFAQVARFRKGY